MPVVVAVIGSIFGLGALALTVDFSPLTGFFYLFVSMVFVCYSSGVCDCCSGYSGYGLLDS